MTAVIHIVSKRTRRALILAALQAARTMDTLMKEVSARFKTFITGFPRFERLHPFEKSVLDLAVGEANYKRILGNADKLRRRAVKVAHHTCMTMHVPATRRFSLTAQSVQVGKEYASKAKAAKTPVQASICSDEGMKAVHQVLTVHGKGVLWELQHLARQLRQVPQIDLCVPTVSPSKLSPLRRRYLYFGYCLSAMRTPYRTSRVHSECLRKLHTVRDHAALI